MSYSGYESMDLILNAISNIGMPKKMPTEQEKALKEFNNNLSDIAELLETITAHCVDNHMDKNLKDINWSTVGDTDYVKEKLTELIEFLDIKE